MSKCYIGLDDTDTLTSPGTGHLARQLASVLTDRYVVAGVTRHQLLQDPRVPMTAKNSANVVHLELSPEDAANLDLARLADEVAGFLRAHFQPGSDPGLCVAMDVPPAVIDFGRRTQTTLVTAGAARMLADEHDLILRALGGDGSGIIGALAGAGLAATGNDGRFTRVGTVRDLAGVQPVEKILDAGISSVQTPDGRAVHNGLVETNGKLRPALIGGEAVLLVEPAGDVWRAVRRD